MLRGWHDESTLQCTDIILFGLDIIIKHVRNWNGYHMPSISQAIRLSLVLPGDNHRMGERTVHRGSYSANHSTWVSDASDSRICYYNESGSHSQLHMRRLLPRQRRWSSSRRELLSLLIAFTDHVGILNNTSDWKTIFWITDSQNVCSFLAGGSGKEYILTDVLDIYDRAIRAKVDLRPIWTLRTDSRILKADAGTRGFNSDDWIVPEDVFTQIVNFWGVPTVDLFASHSNAKCEKFYSVNYEVESARTDAFTFAWTGEHAYLAPPVSKILMAAKKIALTNMTAVLIIPCWPGCRFWPHLFPDGRHAAQMILHIQLCLLYTSPSPRDRG